MNNELPQPEEGNLQRLSPEDKKILLAVARQSLHDYLSQRRLPDPRTDRPALLQPRAAFVTLRRHDTGELRGCRGESQARRPLIESVTLMAVASAVDDPRFPPVTLDELPRIIIEINALTPLKPITPEEIEIGRHGLMIVREANAGLLLPEVPARYGWDVETFLRALCRKAWLPDDAWRDPNARLFAFESEVWEENDIISTP